MKTALTLSNDQIARMLAFAKDRMAGIESQRAQGWLAAREKFEMEFDDDFTHREWNSGVFSKSNESLGLIGGGIDFIRSRLLEEIFGVSPWLGIAPRTRVGEAPELAEEITRHLTWKLGPEQMEFERHATEVITTACKLGECVSKVVHTTDVDHFERIATVLIDGQTGKPTVDQTGEFVFLENGTQVGQMQGADGQTVNYVYPTGQPQIILGTDGGGSEGSVVSGQLPAGQTGTGAAEPGAEGNGDAQTSAAGGSQAQLGNGQDVGGLSASSAPQVTVGRYSWKEQIITDQRVRYVGAKAIPLHFKELYVPLNAKSIQEADFVAHKTSMRLSTVLQQLGMDKEGEAVSGPGVSVPAGNSSGETPSGAGGTPALPGQNSATGPEAGGSAYLQTIVSRIKSNSAMSKAAGDQPNREQGEGGLPDPVDGDPQFAYTEAYFTFDVFGDGRPVRVFFTFDYDSETPIFWDYISNVTPDGRYPFVATVMNQVAHRWYGTSWFKKYELQANLIDKLLNQIVYRNHIAANPIKFRRKEAVVQWQDDQPFDVGPETVLDLNDGFSAKDALDFAEVPELDQQTKYLLDMSVATWRTRSGISAATEGTFGATPAENTATGTQRIVATGNTQFKPIILDVKRGLEDELRMLAKCQYYYQEDEEYTFQQNDARLVTMLTRDKVRDLDLVLELKLTNLKATERLQQSQLAANLGGKFLQIPAPFQPIFAPVYEQVFQALQIDDADEFFKKIVATGQQIAQQDANKPPGNKIAEAISYKDLGGNPSWVQIQMLKLAGIAVPAPVEQAALAALMRGNGPNGPDGQGGTEPQQNQNNANDNPGGQAGAGAPNNGYASAPQDGQPGSAATPGDAGAGAGQPSY